jgi:Brp/Blh family beta-carotene 15,15'-monooxygenase
MVSSVMVMTLLMISPLAIGWQIICLCLSVMILGIPHGAMDHRVAQSLMKSWTYSKWVPLFVTGYLGFAGVMLWGWYVAPVMALLVFLLISALHFGLGDLEQQPGTIREWSRGIVAFTRGAIPIGLPIVFHFKQVSALFSWLMPVGNASIRLPMSEIYWVAVAVAIPAFSIQCLLAIKRRDWIDLWELCLLGFVFYGMPPLIGFAIYFGMWHAPRHLIELAIWRGQQSQGKSVDDAEESRFLMRGFWHVSLEAIPLTLLTWAVMALGWYILRKHTSVDASTVRVIFVSLSALTVPHMILTAAAQRQMEY